MSDKKESIQMSLFDYFLDDKQFSLREATSYVKEEKNLDVNNASIRARIYEGIDRGIFKRLARGVYQVVSQIGKDISKCLLVNGDGRDLSFLKDSSIDGIVTDHPYALGKSLKGGNRKFADYELFRYTEKDFKEKARILKDGAFDVEFLPEENADNFEYLYKVKKMAIANGFQYYAKVSWIKGTFVSNTGRKQHNCEDVLFLTKGKPRALKPNAKKNKQVALDAKFDIKGLDAKQIFNLLVRNNLPVSYMTGTAGMLPKAFDVQPPAKKERVHQAEKPVKLLKQIIKFISKPYETLLDQFAGSGNLGIACSQLKRNSIIVEKDKATFDVMKDHISSLIEGSKVEQVM